MLILYPTQLNKNDKELVKFPSSGTGFERYRPEDAGGTSINPSEIVGPGDHYVNPVTAAALFGVINNLKIDGITLSLGDMSSSSGSDPWQTGGKHHKGHGHNGKRLGLDVDFRYSNAEGNDMQKKNAFKSPNFSLYKNTSIYRTSEKFGFRANYQGLSGSVFGVSKIDGHNDHGHLGLEFKNINWQSVMQAPTFNNGTSYIKIINFSSNE